MGIAVDDSHRIFLPLIQQAQRSVKDPVARSSLLLTSRVHPCQLQKYRIMVRDLCHQLAKEAPIMAMFKSRKFVFDNPFQFDDRYPEDKNYFRPAEELSIRPENERHINLSNLIP
jgi:hypothetical protein